MGKPFSHVHCPRTTPEVNPEIMLTLIMHLIKKYAILGAAVYTIRLSRVETNHTDYH